KTLIDFRDKRGGDYCSWGSVLKNPDRLPPYDIAIKDMLGFSSQNPDRLRQGDIRSAVKLGFSSQKP
ncbi:hypothetical protein ACQX2J_06860, partial [Corynebacterium diphtheriae]